MDSFMLGTFEHTIDAKKRIFVPAKFRTCLGESFVITRDLFVNCLKIYSVEGWTKFISVFVNGEDDEESDKMMRYLSKHSIQVEPDAQGRVILSQDLIDHAGITKNVVVLGMNDCVEIWSAERYQKDNEDEDPDFIKKLAKSVKKSTL